MRSKRRTNFLWGLAALAVALTVLLNTLQIMPQPVFDLLARSWPVLLVLAGLSIVLRSRIPFGSAIALLLSAGLVGGVAAYAFSTRASQQRDDYREPVLQTISNDVTLLRLQIQTLATDVELLRRVGADRVITGQFVGSTESVVSVVYDESDVAASLRVTEQQANQLPLLERMGRGTLRLELPPDVPLDIELQGVDGAVLLNTSGLSIERLNLDLQRGDTLVTLPIYAPQGSAPGDLLGTLAVRGGDLTLFVDPAVAAWLDLNRMGSGIEPVVDLQIYNYLVGDVLKARDIDTAEIVVHYALTVPRGQITVRQPLLGE